VRGRVLIDRPFAWVDGRTWCHLWEENLDLRVLHAFARSIGLKRCWFHNRPGFPHYDVRASMIARAIRRGAVQVNVAEWLQERSRRIRNFRIGQTMTQLQAKGWWDGGPR